MAAIHHAERTVSFKIVYCGTPLGGKTTNLQHVHRCLDPSTRGDLFSMAVRGTGEVPTPLEDAIRNMAVIEAVFRSARENAWVQPQSEFAASTGARSEE